MGILKNNKGITLVSLIITVVVLVLIAGTATYTGMDVYQDAKEEAFIQELQIVQNAVNNEHSKIELASLNDENQDGAFDYIYNLTWKSRDEIPSEVLSNLESMIGEGNGYRYFERKDLEEIGVYGVTQPVMINFTTRDVISVNGFEGKYKLSEFDGTINYNSNVILRVDDVPIPNGFVYLTGSKDEGLVIKNIADGNEFVWVPVENTEVFTTLTNFSKGVTSGREPDVATGATTTNENGETISDLSGTSYDALETNTNAIIDSGHEGIQGLKEQFQDEYIAMVSSVEKYKGFYVGRYETGWDTTENKAVSKVGNAMIAATDLASIGWLIEQENSVTTTRATWYGLYKKQKELYTNNSESSVISGMIYGCQWDAIMKWMSDEENPNVSGEYYINNSTGMGYYDNTNKYIPTGSMPEYKVKNIFDLAGNYWEWTQEINEINNSDVSQGRARRGGASNTSGEASPASYRVFSAGQPINVWYDETSRLQLYIKVD